MTYEEIVTVLGADAESLLQHESKTFPKAQLHLPGPDFVDRVFAQTNRSPQVLRNLQQLHSHGRLAGTGYISILPIDQDIEHTAGVQRPFAEGVELLNAVQDVYQANEITVA